MLRRFCRLFHPAHGSRTSSEVNQTRSVYDSAIDPWVKATTSEGDTTQDAMNPYQYTTGRWLHKDDERRLSRYVKFDFAALLQCAVNASPGATKAIGYQKFEGGFNRAFAIELDNQEKVIAKIPFKHSGAPRLRTNSEVATISYIRATTKIPVPEILAWSDTSTNEVGSEYIIMRHARGVQLHQLWPSMNGKQHFNCVRKLAEYTRDLSRLKFPAFGCLYFDTDILYQSQKIAIGNGFCIGPSCHPDYWSSDLDLRTYTRRPPNQGPWRNLSDYTDGLVDIGYSRIPEIETTDKPSYFGSISTHLSLIESSQNALVDMIKSPQITEIAAPMLLHPDLHKRNVFVSDIDPNSITCLIDWQFTSICPIFHYTEEMPDFLFPHNAIENLVSAELGADATPGQRAERAKKIATRFEIIQKLYTTALKGWIPLYWQARSTDPALLRLFRYCSTSWHDGATALRQELIDLSQQWSTFNLPSTCPFHIHSAELDAHTRLFSEFERRNELKALIIQCINCDSDGWVPADLYEDAKDICHEIYVEYLKEAQVDTELPTTEDQADRLWPFDAR